MQDVDLYDWLYRSSPSGFVADCFDLARRVRVLDMRASPYDLSELGHEPVRIETPEGRGEYASEQAAFADEARGLRARLAAAAGRI